MTEELEKAESRLERIKNHLLEKRREFAEALRARKVGDPVSIAVSIGISLAVSAATSLLTGLFTPKPQPVVQGKLSGELIIQSSFGEIITELYGGSPEVELITGTPPTWTHGVHVSIAVGSVSKNSGGNAFNAFATATESLPDADTDGFVQFVAGPGTWVCGFAATDNLTSLHDFLFGFAAAPPLSSDVDGLLSAQHSDAPGTIIGKWKQGEVFRVEHRSGVFRLYKGDAEYLNFVAPAAVYPLHPVVVFYNVPASITNSEFASGTIGPPLNAGAGGVRVSPQIIWTSGIRENKSVSRQETGGGKGFGSHQSQEVINITYDLDLAAMWGRGPLKNKKIFANTKPIYDSTTGQQTGVTNSDVDADDDYDHENPPDPRTSYNRPNDRYNGSPVIDETDVRTGTLLHGGGSQIALYPGNDTQNPDPTIQAAIDAQFGAGSTPAYRKRNYSRHSQFQLSDYGGVMPNLNGILEHAEIKTVNKLCEHFCQRVSLQPSDYNFTALSGLNLRGLRIQGRRYAPSEIMEGPLQDVFGLIFTEIEGVITGLLEDDTPTVTIDDSEIGWLESDEVPEGPLPELDSFVENELKLPRRVDVNYIDPGNEFETGSQGEKRQVTTGQQSETLQVEVTLIATEARAVAARKLYHEYVKGTTHRFQLSWTYLYLHAGYKIIVTRDEGFTHSILLSSITPALGVLECEGYALEPSVFTQPAVGVDGGGFEVLPVPIPAMTVLGLMDVSLLRDKDALINNGVGIYACGVPRTGSSNQKWRGFSLWMDKIGWERVANFTLPATMGRVV
ncbi:MAG: phage tail protein, partial [Pyrinomonadaceae bacterium]